MTTLLRGEPVADPLLESVREDLAVLERHGVAPTLGTVLMSDDPADRSFMELKAARCAELGVGTERVDVPPDAPAAELYRTVERLAADEDVTAMFVQIPLPDHVDEAEVRRRVPPAADVDCFAPANLGRLVAGDPCILPATPAAVLRLLDHHGIETAGCEAVIVGRNAAIARPLANLLLARGRDATVTVCHTATRDLAAKTRRADLLVTAAGSPGLIDGSMVTEGVAVVDVSANRIEPDRDGKVAAGTGTEPEVGADSTGTEPGSGGGETTGEAYELVGDVDFESVGERASAITPVPGGVGPVTVASLLRNVVDATAREAGLLAELDGGGRVG